MIVEVTPVAVESEQVQITVRRPVDEPKQVQIVLHRPEEPKTRRVRVIRTKTVT